MKLQTNKIFSSFAVKDIEATRRFYHDILGLETSNEMGQLVLHLGGDKTVFVYGKPDHAPANFTVLNLPVNDLKSSMTELRDKNVQFEIYKEGMVKTDDQGVMHGDGTNGPKAIAWFKDPSGNIFSLLEE